MKDFSRECLNQYWAFQQTYRLSCKHRWFFALFLLLFRGKDHIHSLDIGIFVFQQPLVSINFFFLTFNPTLPFSNRSFSRLHFILSGKENRWPLSSFEKLLIHYKTVANTTLYLILNVIISILIKKSKSYLKFT